MTKEDNLLVASEGCVLYYIPESMIWGRAARLASYKGHMLTEEDFKEININDIIEIDGKQYVFRGWSYADIKTFIIKLHYSNDDQIAIMLNGDDLKMREMQEWRDYASEIARKYTNK